MAQGRVEARTLKGFRDFLPADQAGRSAMLATIVRAFESCGFAPLSTPAIEYADILVGKYGEEGDKLLYRFRDNGDRDVALRYDLTVSLARVMAQYRDLPRPFRRYQVGTVWRAEKPAHGRFREFTQCDADIVGSASPLADADCIAAVAIALKGLGLARATGGGPGFAIRVGHRGVLNAVLREAGVSDPAAQVETLRAIDKLDKIGEEAVLGLLAGLDGVGADAGRRVLDALARQDADLPDENGGDHLKAVLAAVAAMGLGEFCRVDLRIARGLDYYTGTVFETTLADLPSIGSVASGGRYDRLLEMFGVPAIPSVGISIGVDRLFAALGELGRSPQGSAGPFAVVCPMGAAALPAALGLVARIREAGVPAECSPDPAVRTGKQIEGAVRRGARFAVLIGEAELASGTAALKDLAAGTQETRPLDAIPDSLRTVQGVGLGQ